MMCEFDYIRLETVPSTNTYAMQRDLAHNTVVVTGAQTDGKGREGRTFVSAKGGAYFSIVRQDELPLAQCARYMLAAPLAVLDALAQLGIESCINWPNDVLVEGAKICGILIETRWQADRVAKAVVGVGVNVNNDLSAVPARVTSVRQRLGKEGDVDALIEHVCRAFDRYMRCTTAQLAHLVAPRLYTLGKQVTLADGREGRALALLADGSLSVETTDGVVTVTAGDVIVKEDVC